MVQRRITLESKQQKENAPDIQWLDTLGNLVLFNGSASKEKVLSWCADNALGAYALMPSDLTLFVRPKVNEISGITIPPSNILLKSKFMMAFENTDDITRLKLTL